jgi:hypothetical protein
VYGRFGKPCLRCATPVEVTRHGEQARVTYWCPGCQVYLPLPERGPDDDTGADDERPRRFSWRRKHRRAHDDGDRLAASDDAEAELRSADHRSDAIDAAPGLPSDPHPAAQVFLARRPQAHELNPLYLDPLLAPEG